MIKNIENYLKQIKKEDYKNCRVEHLGLVCDVLAKYTKDYNEGLLADDEYFIKLQEIIPKLNWMITEMANNEDY